MHGFGHVSVVIRDSVIGWAKWTKFSATLCKRKSIRTNFMPTKFIRHSVNGIFLSFDLNLFSLKGDLNKTLVQPGLVYVLMYYFL